MIKNNEDFFAGLGNVDEVFVLGHSLAEVDSPLLPKVS
ncbi:bacteriophage abortive infection AbiH family protein [Vibrio vulnificus]|nr:MULTISPECIES: bacteriophage abortive infection AbiH family protein [Vibrio]MCU8469636.1 bacteriophage abortive infection AbiH family protein [Vibrio vulnificus]MCU8552829.1 bacteriophage abortive infection AbiH family protein [Vibrio vulnificus]